jgi:hypothetical protein
MIDSDTCRANAAEAAAFAATIDNAEVRRFWEQTAEHWMEKAEIADLQARTPLSLLNASGMAR